MHGEQDRRVSPRRRIDASKSAFERSSYHGVEVAAKIPLIRQPADELTDSPFYAKNSVTPTLPSIPDSGTSAPLWSGDQGATRSAGGHPTGQVESHAASGRQGPRLTQSSAYQSPPAPPSHHPALVEHPFSTASGGRVGDHRLDHPHLASPQPAVTQNSPPHVARTSSGVNSNSAQSTSPAPWAGDNSAALREALEIKTSNAKLWFYRAAGFLVAAAAIWLTLSAFGKDTVPSQQLLDAPNWPPTNFSQVADTPIHSTAMGTPSNPSYRRHDAARTNLDLTNDSTPNHSSQAVISGPTTLPAEAGEEGIDELTIPPSNATTPATLPSRHGQLTPAQRPVGSLPLTSPISSSPGPLVAETRMSSDDYPETPTQPFPAPTRSTLPGRDAPGSVSSARLGPEIVPFSGESL